MEYSDIVNVAYTYLMTFGNLMWLLLIGKFICSSVNVKFVEEEIIITIW